MKASIVLVEWPMVKTVGWVIGTLSPPGRAASTIRRFFIRAMLLLLLSVFTSVLSGAGAAFGVVRSGVAH
jgi:hypothetical protein